MKDKIVTIKDGSAPAKFGYINFETPAEARNAYNNAKTDQDVLKMLNSAIPHYEEFLFYHQSKDDRKKQLENSNAKKNNLDMKNPE